MFGTAGIGVLKKSRISSDQEPDGIFVFGVCLLTVFAQAFSLFYKIGALANGVLILLDLLFIILFREDICAFIALYKRKGTGLKYACIVIVLLTIVFLKYASDPMRNYDTYLYHAQAIRWIEEYGVIPGLGNLHHRLAYNSAVLPLQALFSLKFLWGERSLHSINGFIGVLFLSYAICSLKVWRIHKFYISDFFRAVLIYYIASQNDRISSPGTDFFALVMVLYIFIKWISLVEEKERDIRQYICLCFMCIFAVSLKLSVAMIIILILDPAIRLIRKKQWRQISIYAVWGLVMVLPFLIRNMILSGYLIYPFQQLDVFHFDWKMPIEQLVYEKNEIKAWAMGLNDAALCNASLTEWFPAWQENLTKIQKTEFYAFPLLAFLSVCIAIEKLIKQKVADYLWIVITMIALVLFWFLEAPDLRFGGIFLLLLPCFVVGNLAEYMNYKIQEYNIPLIIMLICVIYNSHPFISTLIAGDFDGIIWEQDYEMRECSEVYLGTERFYVPIGDDRAGYYAFPSSPYEEQILSIELRGGSLEDGFRRKK